MWATKIIPGLVQISAPRRPHIVVIVADDLGWNDVSWHNPAVRTPQLASLARAGVRLEQVSITL